MGFQIENTVLIKYTEEPGVTEVVIPEGITEIKYEAFKGCTSLSSITIPEGVTEIDWRAFMGCNHLTSITIPDSVTHIGFDAFKDCRSLTSLDLPEGIELSRNPFTGCAGLADPDGFVIMKNKLLGYYGEKTDIIVPDNVTAIAEHAFQNCQSLMSIILPSQVTTIGFGAFDGCSCLTEVKIYGAVSNFNSYAFDGCFSLKKLQINALSMFEPGQMDSRIIEPIFPEDYYHFTSTLPSWTIPFIPSIPVEEAAYVLLNQSGKKWQELAWRSVSGQKEALLRSLVHIVEGSTAPLKNSVFNRAYTIAADHCSEVSAEVIRNVTEALKKNNPKAAKKADWSVFEAVLNAPQEEEPDDDTEYEGILSGYEFCVPAPSAREIRGLIRHNGGKIVKEMNDMTDFLIVSTTDRTAEEKARKRKVRIMPEEVLRSLCKVS